MTGWEYLAGIMATLFLAALIGIVCAIGAAFFVHLAREAWRDLRAWVKAWHERRATGYLMRQVRNGRAGI